MSVTFEEDWRSLTVRPQWGRYVDDAAAAFANKQVADYVSRLWFAKEVTFDAHGIYLALHGKMTRRGRHGRTSEGHPRDGCSRYRTGRRRACLDAGAPRGTGGRQ